MNSAILPVVGFIAVLAIWQLAAALGLLNRALVDAPGPVLAYLWQLLQSAETWHALWVTLRRTLFGFGVSAVAGATIGLTIGYFEFLRRTLAPVIDFLRSIPGVALLPLFIVTIGVGEGTRFALVVVPTTLIVVTYTMLGVRNSSKTRQIYAKSLGTSRLQVFLKVVIPEALPSTVAGLRASISVALVLVLVAEMMMTGGAQGVGQGIYNSRFGSNYTEMYSLVILSGMMGYAMNRCVEIVDERLIHWRGR